MQLNKTVIGAMAGALLTAGVGAWLVWTQDGAIGEGLSRLSYDFSFRVRTIAVPPEVAIVYLDENSRKGLNQPENAPWDRRLHVALLERLIRDRARLVFYDVIFKSPQNPEVDARFADAMRRHGRVILGADLAEAQHVTGGLVKEDILTPPLELFRQSAAGWGLVKVSLEPGSIVRRIHSGSADYPSASWVAASKLGSPATRDSARRLEERWMNYYGPARSFKWVSLQQALAPDGVPPRFFENKLVFIGALPSISSFTSAKDLFGNPYTRFSGGNFSPGVEIHATTLMNLVRNEWLHRVSIPWQSTIAVIWGIVLGAGLMFLRPWIAGAVAVVSLIPAAIAILYLQWSTLAWWSWTVPMLVETPVALIWSVGYQYLVENRQKRRLRRAFGSYLSPYMADQIAESRFDLRLGGSLVETTVMFTDLEGFTTMSETMSPSELTEVLTTYFNLTTRSILEQNGTIIKYIGDAVLAVWGAPVTDPGQADHAVRAAWGMFQAGQTEIFGRRLRTRIGINTGEVLAGNLGSDFRFDYTVIGDAVNFASRLEGLNKYLGTDILISDSTRRKLSGEICVRCLGQFQVVGKTQAVTIHEVLGLAASGENFRWIEDFERGVELFVRRDFELASALFHQVINARGGVDGPSRLYLKEIDLARAGEKEEGWTGTILVKSK